MDNRLTCTSVTGVKGGESFLITSKESAVLVETGFGCSADKTVSNLKRELDGRKLDHILLTHSHYDHAGGTPAIKAAFPEATIVASETCAYVFTRPGALATIRKMDLSAAEMAGLKDPGPDLTPELSVDLIRNVGDEIKTQDLTIKVISGLGHTRCCQSYFFEEDSLLVATESSGCQVATSFQAAFLVSYKEALLTIEMIRQLAPRYILSPHYRVLTESESAEYPNKAKKEATETADFILSRHKAGASFDEIYSDFVEKYYNQTIRSSGYQPRFAFEVNAKALIPRLIEEMAGDYS